MTIKLCDPIPDVYMSSAKKSIFFAAEESLLEEYEEREKPSPGMTCNTNVFLGFFFDGTKNNYIKAEAGKNHSNVVRLYDCFPGESVPGVLPGPTDWDYEISSFKNFFRVYIPGVASPFKEVGDSGEGLDETLGAATGRGGQARIAWALIQALNNVHRYFLGSPLVGVDEQKRLANSLDLSAWHRQGMYGNSSSGSDGARDATQQYATQYKLEALLKKLHQAVSQHWHLPGCRPLKIDPGVVKTIHVSAFGFSRGATQARAFANWFLSVCELDARLCGKAGRTLGGFPVEFDFLGLFDTVASVGTGNSFGNRFWGRYFDGHGAWADAESNLRIPEGIKCLHLVAAHEIRRSFPLDSITVRGMLPANCQEIVIPGVHSDIGSGYCPTEQGRGVDPAGADMISRIPLILMYRTARLSGVPLKLERAPAAAQQRFAVSKNVIDDLNAYLSQCKIKQGSLTDIMREQAQLRMLYHRARRISGTSPITKTQSFLRATNFDKNDLESAYRELEVELSTFEEQLKSERHGSKGPAQKPGFDNEKSNEWLEIARWWEAAEPAPAAVLNLFDEYIHDSRAWFKLSMSDKDNEPEALEQLEKWSHRIKSDELRAEMMGVPVRYSLAAEKIEAVREYSKTGKLPRMRTEGREDWEIAGYLRYRKVYSGGDRFLISKNQKAKEPQVTIADIRKPELPSDSVT